MHTIKQFALAAALALVAASACGEEIATRYGTLKITDDNTLLFKNRPFKPEIQGNNSLSAIGTYRVDNTDIVLIQDNGGTACPALYYFIAVSAGGAKATSPFGTCSDLIDVKQSADGVSVAMSGFGGPGMPRAAQKKVAKEKHLFAFKGGVLTDNGVPVK